MDSPPLDDRQVPQTQVLAIASHVAHGFVGNTMASFVMRILGCNVTAINTVEYSNHAAYGRFRGTVATPDEIANLFTGLCDAGLDTFDVLLTGYMPNKPVLDQVGRIAKELKGRRDRARLFWLLDPVMGDLDRLYVPEDEVDVYRCLLADADMVVPNQFELGLLSGNKTATIEDIATAVGKLHQTYRLKHIVVTSVRLDGPLADSQLAVIGSTATSDCRARLFRIDIPAFPAFFSGTGDMFAGLMVGRLREAVASATVDGSPSADRLSSTPGWVSSDVVKSVDLPLAKATQKVLASMHAVLAATYRSLQARLPEAYAAVGDDPQARKTALTRESEVQVVRNAASILEPRLLDRFEPTTVVLA